MESFPKSYLGVFRIGCNSLCTCSMQNNCFVTELSGVIRKSCFVLKCRVKIYNKKNKQNCLPGPVFVGWKTSGQIILLMSNCHETWTVDWFLFNSIYYWLPRYTLLDLDITYGLPRENMSLIPTEQYVYEGERCGNQIYDRKLQ